MISNAAPPTPGRRFHIQLIGRHKHTCKLEFGELFRRERIYAFRPFQ